MRNIKLKEDMTFHVRIEVEFGWKIVWKEVWKVFGSFENSLAP